MGLVQNSLDLGLTFTINFRYGYNGFFRVIWVKKFQIDFGFFEWGKLRVGFFSFGKPDPPLFVNRI